MVMISSYWGVWGDVPNHLVRLALAFLFALPVGWNRERQARSAGLRTFPIVAIASCGFVILAIEILGERSTAQARVLEGLITGVFGMSVWWARPLGLATTISASFSRSRTFLS